MKVGLILIFGLLVLTATSSAALRNRYSFNEPPGSTVVIDSVSGSNGVARVLSTTGGAVPTFDGNQVTLDGVGGYIDLPNGLVSGLTNVTFEMWVTWTSGGIWTRLLDFGNNSNGEDTNGTDTLRHRDQLSVHNRDGGLRSAVSPLHSPFWRRGLHFALVHKSYPRLGTPLRRDVRTFPTASHVH